MDCDPNDLGEIQDGAVNFDDINVGSVATYTCDFAYKLVGGNETRTCVLVGSSVVWNGETPMCECML